MKDIGVFARASWNDGQNEILSFTDIDRSVSGGFSIKGSYWGPVKSAPIILFANTNLRIANPFVDIEDSVDNTNIASFVSVFPGQDANGNPTSNASITVPANTILANSDFGYIVTYGEPITGIDYLTVDTSSTRSDNTSIRVDQTQLHAYII